MTNLTCQNQVPGLALLNYFETVVPQSAGKSSVCGLWSVKQHDLISPK